VCDIAYAMRCEAADREYLAMLILAPHLEEPPPHPRQLLDDELWAEPRPPDPLLDALGV
jgi:hypothetical protein